MITCKLSIAVATFLLFLAPQIALGLAPGNPSIFLTSEPEEQEAPAGGSATYTISVLSQEGFEDMVELTLVDPPAGVTATFDPNPVEVPGFLQGDSVMTVNVAADASPGEVELKVNGKGVTETDVQKSVNVRLIILSGGAPPPVQPPPASDQQPPADQQPPPDQEPPVGPAVTTTVTSTVTTTVTTATTVVSTVTEVMTTRTPTIGTITTADFEQVADFTYPTVALVVVVALLAVAALALRRPK